ncbi:hypothetical protein CANINC_000865 [Pichia inconspicua]|uniref:Mitochondrial outer membrane transport complex Sam37/metaxin N-terminal domain-containing protein n=1 Tax=Pichia inconspicua TaxID=52247 RepID=A0A4T0X684_9ASCO|nr:hypothetical protein CANINC_000865 [[Candida] inconspicua]
MAAPASWATFHNTFPKALYPQETHSEVYRGRQYSIGSTSKSTTRSSLFNLGVYNLFPLQFESNEDSHLFLAPVDPLCLLTLLSVIDRDGLKLPTSSDVLVDSSSPHFNKKCSVSILSYQAALDDQLPILIEDSINTEAKQVLRKIHHSKLINTLNSSNLSNENELTFNLINETLFDLYTLFLLDLDDETLLKYYSLFHYNYTETMQSITILSKFFAKSVRLHLLKRNDFYVRNPDTFNYFSSVITPKYTKLAYQSERTKIINNGKELLSLLNSVLVTEKFWNGEKAGIVDFQIASYIYSFSYMSKYIPFFKELIDENNALIRHNSDVLSSFI